MSMIIYGSLYGTITLLMGYFLSLLMTVGYFNVFILLITRINFRHWSETALIIESRSDINNTIGYDSDRFLELVNKERYRMFTTIMLCDAETRQDLGIQVVDVSLPYDDDFQLELESRGLDWHEYYPE